MNDHARGGALIALALVMGVLAIAARDGLGSWPGRVQLAIAGVGLAVGIWLIVGSRSR